MSRKATLIILLLFGVVIYFPIFLHLDYGGLYRWDESNNAVHAYEMSQNGNYLRRFFQGAPETWETKPPLLIWLQVLSIKVFGYNALSIRFSSALAALLTVVLIVRFFMVELKNLWGGIFSALVLLTSAGYIRGHVARTGDHDALLILFLIGGLIFFYKYLLGEEAQKGRSLLLFFVCFIAGVMTKSIAGLFFAPALLVFTITYKKLSTTLRDKRFWWGIMSFVLVIGGYYLANEYYYPGYLDLVWDNELFPRYFNVAKQFDYKEMPESFYFTKLLFTNHLKGVIYFLPLSVFLIWRSKNTKVKTFMTLVLLTAFLFQIILSNGTYNSWYNAPIIPLLAMVIGLGLSMLLEALVAYLNVEQYKKYGVVFLFALAVFAVPYRNIILDKCYFKQHWSSEDMYGAFLNELEKRRPALKDFFVFHEVRNRHFIFYKNVFNEQRGYTIRSCGLGSIKNCTEAEGTYVGDKVMICGDQIQKVVEKRYELQAIDTYQKCQLFEVLAERSTVK